MARVGRPKKNAEQRVRNAGYAALPSEITAIKRIADKRNFRSSFDYLRRLVIDDGDPLSRNRISSPRLKNQTAS